MAEHKEKRSKLHRAPQGFNFKEHILTLEDRIQLVIFGIIGTLLIVFPNELRTVAPYLTGAALILYGFICLIHWLNHREEEADVGYDLIYIVLGIAILYHRQNSLAAIGSIWALFTLTEVAEEINEAFHFHDFSIIRMLIGIASTALAILLLFDPVEHFAFHVRILGLEMVLSIFARWGNREIEEAAKMDAEFEMDEDLLREAEEELSDYVDDEYN
ncbi:MAG: DUF308 domain-containing protein [Lachnospiraceae bacterium]|nr:DUF308 domain-containing protein [Lachnospiraceae bacterium]